MHDLNIARPLGPVASSRLVGGRQTNAIASSPVFRLAPLLEAAPRNTLLMCAILFATKPTHGTIKKP